MTDIATLGIRVESQQAEVAEDRLDGLAAAADRAEAQVEGLSAAARGTAGPLQGMNAAITQQQRALALSRNAMGLTAAEGLNMSRQMTDVGVQLAMGMSPFLIAIQQGPQIFDIFQQSAIRAGTSIRAAMVATGAAVWGALAPLLPIIAAIAAAGALVAGAWGLATRSMSSDIGDLTEGMNLTEAQMKRLEEQGVSTSITAGDAFRGLGTTIKEMLVETFGDQLDQVAGWWNSFLDGATKVARLAVQSIGAAFIGTFYAVRDTWKMLPAVLGDAAVTAANIAVAAAEFLVNKSIQGINKVLDAAKALAMANPTNPAMMAVLGVNPIDEVSWGGLPNANAGAMGQLGSDIGGVYGNAFNEIGQAMDAAYARWLENTNASGRARLGEAAGDPEKGRKSGKSEAEREIEQSLRYIQSLKDEAATMGMNAIAAKEYEIAQRAAAAAEHGLGDAVRAAGAALLEKMRIEAADMSGKTEQLDMIRLETSLVGAGNVERAVQLAQLAERQRLLAAGLKETDSQFDPAVRAAGDIARAQVEQERTRWTARYLEDQGLALEMMRAELGLIGAGHQARERELALLSAIQDMKLRGVDATSAEGLAILSNVEALARYGAELERTQEAWDMVERFGEGAIDRLADQLADNVRDWEGWKDAVGDILNDLKRDLLELAAVNPLKNWLFGQNNPTLDTIGGFIGSLFGGSATPLGGSPVPAVFGRAGMAANDNLAGAATNTIRAQAAQARQASPVQAGTMNITLKVDVTGAKGDREIETIVQKSVAAGMDETLKRANANAGPMAYQYLTRNHVMRG